MPSDVEYCTVEVFELREGAKAPNFQKLKKPVDKMGGNAAPSETPRPKKKRRAGKHAQDASQLRSVSSTVKRNTISAGPRFVARDRNAPLPLRQQRMDWKDRKRNRGPQKGIFLRKTNSQEFDHAGMKAPECEAAAGGNCQLYCCNGHARL